MTTLTLSHSAIDIAVEAQERDLKWLDRFMYPAFRVVSSTDRMPPVVRFDAGQSAPALPAYASAARVAFVLDQGPVLMSETPIDGGAWLVDDQGGIAFSLRHSPVSVAVHANTSPASGRIALMRVVREYAHNATIDVGGFVLHAAAVAAPQGALLLAGPKGAGKTTMLARLLGLDGIDYLSNDRVAVFDGSPNAYPVPTIVGVREGTRALLPSLSRALAPLPAFTADGDSRPASRTATGTWYFSPRQFAGALSRCLVRYAEMAAFVVLSGFGPMSSRQLDRPAAVDAVRSAVLGRRSGHVTSDVFRIGRRCDAQASIEAGCVRLVARVPVFAVTVPPEPDPAALEAMVRSWR